MPDSVRGYRELGVSESGDGALLDQGEGHINSIRKFWPGDMYDPEVSACLTFALALLANIFKHIA
jgi:hypothetical protein